MNQVDVIALLNSLEDIPSFYGYAPVGTRVPFLVIHVTQPDNFLADDIVFTENWHFRIDLYCSEKSPAIEKEIKALFRENHIVWTRTEDFFEDQAVFEIEFEFDVYGDEE